MSICSENEMYIEMESIKTAFKNLIIIRVSRVSRRTSLQTLKSEKNLKLIRGYQYKIVNSYSDNGSVFYMLGIWERCMFLHMR